MGHGFTKWKWLAFTLPISELRLGAAASAKTMSVLSVGGKGTTCLIRSDKVLRSNTPMTEKVVSSLGAGLAAAFPFLPIHELRQHSHLCLQWSLQHSFGSTVSGKIICSCSQQAEINWFKLCMPKPCFVFWVFLIYFATFPVDLPQVAWFDLLVPSSRHVNSCGITNGVDGYFCMELTALEGSEFPAF